MLPMMIDLTFPFTRLIRLCGLSIVLFLASCSSGFDRSEMLHDLTYQAIVPNHERFVATTAELEVAIDSYLLDPSASNLAVAQGAWQAASLAWMGCMTHRYGVINDALIHNRIDNRPPRVPFIEETIDGGDLIHVELIGQVGSSSQGLSAIEYLLFSPDSLADLAENGRRQAYLQAAAVVLHQNSQALLALWADSGQNYAQAFADADLDGGELQGSMNMLVNQTLSELERITWDRLGKPMGKRSSGATRPDLIEAPYSQSSLARIEATVQDLHRLYTAAEGVGFDDYLDYLEADYDGRPLSEVIDAQFVTSLAALQAIEQPLGQAIEQDIDQVEVAYEALRTLIILLKVDFANQLGVTLTFNDNDGD